MSARQAFVPRPSSCIPAASEAHPQDVRERDGDKDMLVNGNGKPRSITAFLGPKRGAGTDSLSARPPPGPGLGRMNSSTPRRSFEGLLRPEMTPMSIIPYPATVQQPLAGQIPRQTTGNGTIHFQNPMTPVSLSRGLKKGFGIPSEGRSEATSPNGNASGFGNMLIGPGSEVDDPGGEMGEYMRMFEGPGDRPNMSNIQPSVENEIAAPVPGRVLGGLGAYTEDASCEPGSVFSRSSRETGASVERSDELQRSFAGTKRGVRSEEVEDDGWYAGDGNRTHGPAKRMKQVQHDPDGYYSMRGSRAPPTPTLPSPPVHSQNPAMVVTELFENIKEYVDLEEVASDWKRWSECSTEEWLKDAEELAQDYQSTLNMVKELVAEKVGAYAKMLSSIEERRAEVNRNMVVVKRKGNSVHENISELGRKK